MERLGRWHRQATLLPCPNVGIDDRSVLEPRPRHDDGVWSGCSCPTRGGESRSTAIATKRRPMNGDGPLLLLGGSCISDADGNRKSMRRETTNRGKGVLVSGSVPSCLPERTRVNGDYNGHDAPPSAPSSRCFLLPTFSLLRRALGVAATGLLARTDPRRSVIERAITKTFVSWRIMPFARRMRVLLFLKPLGSGQPAI
jgi:hypothetical protein